MAVHAACTVNLPADSIKSRWLEPYVSAAVNQKSIGLQPKGVFAGFIVAPGGAALSLDIQVDPTLLISGANVLETTGGQYCVTLIQTSNLAVDLTTVANSTVYVVLDAQYTVTVTSAAQVLVVDEADLALPAGADYVLLAKVNVPLAGVLATTDINMGYRLTAGDSITSEARPTVNLLPNGTFERDLAGSDAKGWTSGDVNIVISAAAGGAARTGVNCLRLIAGIAVTSDVSTQLVAVSPGVKYRVGGWFRALGGGIVGAGTGIQLRVAWYGPTGGFLSNTDIEAPFKSAVATYVERKAEVTAPAGAAMAQLLLHFDNCSGSAYFDDGVFAARTLEPSADAILGYAGGPNWADATTNPPTTVEGQLDKIVLDLAAASGAAKMGYAGGAAWADATTNPATTVELQLDKVISDLAGTSGAAKLGSAADDYTNAATIKAALIDLGDGVIGKRNFLINADFASRTIGGVSFDHDFYNVAGTFSNVRKFKADRWFAYRATAGNGAWFDPGAGGMGIYRPNLDTNLNAMHFVQEIKHEWITALHGRKVTLNFNAQLGSTATGTLTVRLVCSTGVASNSIYPSATAVYATGSTDLISQTLALTIPEGLKAFSFTSTNIPTAARCLAVVFTHTPTSNPGGVGDGFEIYNPHLSCGVTTPLYFSLASAFTGENEQRLIEEFVESGTLATNCLASTTAQFAALPLGSHIQYRRTKNAVPGPSAFIGYGGNMNHILLGAADEDLQFAPVSGTYQGPAVITNGRVANVVVAAGGVSAYCEYVIVSEH